MVRCPRCQSPNPDTVAACLRCATPLPHAPRAARPRRSDFWEPRALRRLALAMVPLLLLRLSIGSLLTVGNERIEWHFLLFHVLHGLVLAGGLAWAWREDGRNVAAWLACGAAGGLLAEAFEVWYTFHGIMGYASLWTWSWFGLAEDHALVYEILQVLRLAGPALVLGGFYLQVEPRGWRRLQAAAWVFLALALRSQVRGAWLAWGPLASAEGLKQLGLYAFSTLFFAWGLGPRGLTDRGENR